MLNQRSNNKASPAAHSKIREGKKRKIFGFPETQNDDADPIDARRYGVDAIRLNSVGQPAKC